MKMIMMIIIIINIQRVVVAIMFFYFCSCFEGTILLRIFISLKTKIYFKIGENLFDYIGALLGVVFINSMRRAFCANVFLSRMSDSIIKFRDAVN